MPTPLVHLYVSQQILEQFDGPAVALLRRRVGDFMLGSIAPDAWSLGEMTRIEGHVLPIPPPRDVHGAAELLHQYPMLRDAGALRPAQAAFVAGYMTHLLLDEIWYHDLFDPYFLRGSNEPPVRQRLVLHNVLRLAVEDELEPHVAPACIESLSVLQIAYALPPIPDPVLRTWRDLIDAEFSPGGQKRSADVFAERMACPSKNWWLS